MCIKLLNEFVQFGDICTFLSLTSISSFSAPLHKKGSVHFHFPFSLNSFPLYNYRTLSASRHRNQIMEGIGRRMMENCANNS